MAKTKAEIFYYYCFFNGEKVKADIKFKKGFWVGTAWFPKTLGISTYDYVQLEGCVKRLQDLFGKQMLLCDKETYDEIKYDKKR